MFAGTMVDSEALKLSFSIILRSIDPNTKCKGGKTFEHVDREIAALQVLQSIVQEQIIVRKRGRNSQTAIFKLPNELLSLIFLSTVGNDEKTAELQQNIEFTCKRWYHVARRDAVLSNLVSPKRNAALIAESDGCPLNILFSSSGHLSERDNSFIDLVGPHINRWRTFEQHGRVRGPNRFLRHIVRPAPLLETFKAPSFLSCTETINLFGGQAPRLRELSISNLLFKNVDSFPTLRVLSVNSLVEDFISSRTVLLEMLRSCPHLVELYIDNVLNLMVLIPEQSSEEVVSLLSLRKIVLGAGICANTRRTLLLSLHTPQLVSVEIRAGNQDTDRFHFVRTYSDLPVGGVVATVMQSICTIIIEGRIYDNSFKITGSSEECRLTFIMGARKMADAHPFPTLSTLSPMHLPGIRTLYLRDLAGYISPPVLEDFLSYFTGLEMLVISFAQVHKVLDALASFTGIAGWNCPNLTTLVIDRCTFFFQSLHSCIISRYGMGNSDIGPTHTLPAQLQVLDIRSCTNEPNNAGLISEVGDIVGWQVLSVHFL